MSMDRLQHHCSYPPSPTCYLLGIPAYKEAQSWATVIPGGIPLTWDLSPVLSSRRLWKAVLQNTALYFTSPHWHFSLQEETF